MSPILTLVQAPRSDVSVYKLRGCTCRSSKGEAHRSHLINLPVPQHVWKDKLDTGNVSFFSPGNHWQFEVPTTDNIPNENKK